MEKKSKLRIAAKILLCVILIWAAVTAVMLFACDKILIYGHRGLENMFSLTDAEYHAALGGFHVKVPGAAVKMFYPKDSHCNYSEYQDDDTPRYFVKLIYNDKKPRGNVIEHDHYSGYTIEYTRKGPAEHEYDSADAALQRDMLSMMEQIYDMDHVYEPGKDEYSSYSGGQGDEPGENSSICVTWFTLYCHGDGYLLNRRDKTIYSFSEGKLRKIMDVPEKGDFDFCIWKR